MFTLEECAEKSNNHVQAWSRVHTDQKFVLFFKYMANFLESVMKGIFTSLYRRLRISKGQILELKSILGIECQGDVDWLV